MRLPRLFTGAALCLTALLAGAGTAAAKDAVQAGVTIPVGEPVPVMAENGNWYTPGTYAVGTIILNYTYIGMSFPAGVFATFNLNLNVYDPTSPKNDPTYPVELTLSDIGSKHVTLWPASPLLSVTGLGWTSTDPVTVLIPSEVASNPDFMQDGAQIVGNLKMATPGGSQLDTVTNVIVKITLVHPTGPCVKAYSFITDAQLTDTITASEVNVNSKHKVTSTNPYGSLSSNALIVNTCGVDVSFDLKMVLDAVVLDAALEQPGQCRVHVRHGGRDRPSRLQYRLLWCRHSTRSEPVSPERHGSGWFELPRCRAHVHQQRHVGQRVARRPYVRFQRHALQRGLELLGTVVPGRGSQSCDRGACLHHEVVRHSERACMRATLIASVARVVLHRCDPRPGQCRRIVLSDQRGACERRSGA